MNIGFYVGVTQYGFITIPVLQALYNYIFCHLYKERIDLQMAEGNRIIRRIQLASATPSRLNEKARWYSTLASPSNQRLRGVWAMHTFQGRTVLHLPGSEKWNVTEGHSQSDRP